MELLRTDRTYATRNNALRALKKANGGTLDGIRYLVAVNADGRFAPVVVARPNTLDFTFMHRGVTVVN